MNLMCNWVLDAVEHWAAGYSMLRETGALCKDASRMDALLVPVSREAHCMLASGKSFFERPRFVGVEVKVSRSDFLAGMRKGQLEKYQECVSGLYLASLVNVCKTSEVPAGVGHIVCKEKPRGDYFDPICKRHPEYQDIETPPDLPWRCLFRLAEQYRRKLAENEQKFKRAAKVIGRAAAEQIFANIEMMTRGLDLAEDEKDIVTVAMKEIDDAAGTGMLF